MSFDKTVGGSLDKTANSIILNYISGSQLSLTGLLFIKGGSGYVTITSGDTSGSVTHGLGIIPEAGRIHITPTDDLGGIYYWISDTGSSIFVLNVSSTDLSDHIFGWNYI